MDAIRQLIADHEKPIETIQQQQQQSTVDMSSDFDDGSVNVSTEDLRPKPDDGVSDVTEETMADVIF